MGILKRNTKSEILSCQLPRFMHVYLGLLLFLSIQLVSANELIATHDDWTVSYGEDRKSVVTVTLNADRMVFGFVCALSKEADCTIGAHLSAQCDENTKVTAKILIDSEPLTDWETNCESADNPSTGQSDRVLLSSQLSGGSVDALLTAMRNGSQAAVTVETNSNKTLRSDFSLSGYSKAAVKMFEILGWESTNSNGIGGNDKSNNSAKRDLEKKKWKF